MELTETYDQRLVHSATFDSPLGPYFALTAGQRIMPSYLIIGAQKAGTSSLYSYLIRHPEVIPAQKKEVGFFHDTTTYRRGLRWYRRHFAHRLYQRYYERRYRVRSITGEASSNYLAFTKSAGRVAAAFPAMSLIVLLRNPVDRAWSHYRMARQKGFERLDFGAALELESERLSDELSRGTGHDYVYQRLGYRAKGVYVDLLEPWLRHFPREQLLILKSEDLFEKPSVAYSKVLAHLGLGPYSLPRFDVVNQGPKEDLNPAIRESLSAFYAPHNRRLERALGDSFDWS